MRRFLCVAVGVLCAVSVFGQNAGPDIAVVREWVGTLERDVRNEKLNLDLIRESIRRLDRDIEGRISELLDMVSGLEDSAATEGRIRQAKQDMVAALRRSVDFYVKVREQDRAQGWDTTKLNERVDVRLEQMAKLAASIDDGEGSKKPAGRVLTGGDMEDAIAALKEGRETGHVVRNRDDLIEEIAATVAFLSQRSRILTRKLDYLTDAGARAAVEKEVAELDAMIAKRKAQLEEARTLPAPAKTAGGMDTVREVEKALRDARLLVLRDHREMVEAKDKLDYSRKRLEHLETQLGKAKSLLAKMEEKTK